MAHEATVIAAGILAGRNIPSERLPRIVVKPVLCGRYSHKTKIITLPEWLWTHNRPPDYVHWYVGHELAHHFNERHGHDFMFQAILWHLCPDTWHWESTYKPKHYAHAYGLLCV